MNCTRSAREAIGGAYRGGSFVQWAEEDRLANIIVVKHVKCYKRNQVVLNLGMVKSGDVVVWTSNFLEDWFSAQNVARPTLSRHEKVDK
ncbi:hypothetical protein QYF36_008153 [Acer negundo]|nr:hypothetical protein QYF36_008153 [Acer negundo]